MKEVGRPSTSSFSLFVSLFPRDPLTMHSRYLEVAGSRPAGVFFVEKFFFYPAEEEETRRFRTKK